MRLRFPLFFVALLVLLPPWARADEHCTPWVARIVSLQGQVKATPVGEDRWRPAQLRETFCAGDSVRIEARSRATIRLQGGTDIRLDAGTIVTFSSMEPKQPSWLELLKGTIHLISRFPYQLEVRTPFVNAAVEGTEFVVRVELEQALLWVFEGRVSFHNPGGRLTLTSGETAVAEAGKAPVRRLLVQPREAVQWALYYPPLIDPRPAVYPLGSKVQGIHEALDYYRTGDLTSAFASLEQVPPDVREASYFTLRAALLLVVGRVDEARPAIQRALQLNARYGTERLTPCKRSLRWYRVRKRRRCALPTWQQNWIRDRPSPKSPFPMRIKRSLKLKRHSFMQKKPPIFFPLMPWPGLGSLSFSFRWAIWMKLPRRHNRR